MTNPEIRLAKRLVSEMQRISGTTQLSTLQHDAMLSLFQGLGLALAFCYEEFTGKEAKNLKPIELIQWAINLPKVEKRGRLVG